ncbi:MAG: cysteine--tRNA ligase [Patescibacteria group bacterium]|jgi:cysteinyl-tRNA synthetase
MLKLWNSLTRTREAIGPINPGEVRMYSCGPTVYSMPHIGNFRSYVTWDILRRVLVANGFKVVHCMNITDVGHLVGDGDEGQDKLQMSADKEGISAWDIAKRYEKIFVDYAKVLNIKLPDSPLLCRATDHIEEQIKLIQLLEEKGFTYKTSDGIYFDTAKFPDYGKLSGQPLDEKLEGARVDVNKEKRQATDFALWKFSYPNGVLRQEFLDSRIRKNDKGDVGRGTTGTSDEVPQRHMEWESPWGVGFPGWHVECSAMSHKYLGQPFDIHTGGVDHIPVHHENEIAQSMAAYNVPLANFWVHNDFMRVEGQKMSKSLGNVYTLDDCKAKGIEPLAIRYFFLGAHYRSKLNFTWEAAQAAQNALNNLREFSRELAIPTDQNPHESFNDEFMSELNDDLNTPAALAVVWNLVKSDVESSVKASTLLAWDKILGLDLDKYIAKPVEIPEHVKQIAQRRWEARSRQDWPAADQLRNELDSLGWNMEDGAAEFKLKPKV